MIRLILPDPTPMELCEVCGEVTDTPPICLRCDCDQDDSYRRLVDP
jgi:hypothetical protein